MEMTITTQTEGRRTYIMGDTYPIRDTLRAGGAPWDADRKAWWLGDRDRAAALAAKIGPATEPTNAPAEAPCTNATVAGRAVYKGKTYYIAGRVVRGRTHWDDRVAAVTTRDGAKIMLYSRDGKCKFWAPLPQYGAVVKVGAAPDPSAAQITKTYDKPQTIGSLRRFAAEARDGFPGRTTCYMCGSPSCDGAGGGLCEHD